MIYLKKQLKGTIPKFWLMGCGVKRNGSDREMAISKQEIIYGGGMDGIS